MECVSVMGKCRACYIKTQEEFQIPIFARENLQQIFREVTSLEIHENDKFPGILCEECHSRLMDAHKFRQMCSSSALAFQQILSEDDDNDFEEKYKPPELVDVPGVEDVVLPEQDCDLEEKINPLGSVVVDKKRNEYSLSVSKNPVKLKPKWKIKNEAKKKKPETTTIKTVAGMELKCNDCGKMYNNKSSLRTHRNTIHRGFEVVKCDICGREFQRLELLRNHMARLHEAKDMLKCTECFRVFRTAEGLANHKKEWHDPDNPKEKPKNHVCEYCGKAFTCATHLQEHSSIHSGIKPHKCTFCSRHYLTKHQLKVHIMRCHEGIKKHVCTICGAQKATLRELQLHMNQHNQERISCEQCSKTFISVVNLNLHVRTVHQGIKDYTCSHCGQNFARPGTLKHHIMTHTGEKPHECEKCGKRFIQLTALNSHRRTHGKLK